MAGEFELIRRYLAPLAAAAPGALDLRDDAALLTPPAGCELVLTADALVAGVHFLADDPPDAIARKMLRVNLSDLAAMGAKPLGYLMTIAWPGSPEEAWIARFVEGLAADQARFGCPLLGGDTTRTPGPLTLSVTALGAVAQGHALRRTTAQAGDLIYLSGTLGDGALGLLVAQGGLPDLAAAERAHLLARYRLPEPRLALGQALAEAGLATAALDLSDGLAADLGHILVESGLAGVVERAPLPLSAAARNALAADPALWTQVLTGGDDYELLFTAAPDQTAAIATLAARLALPLTQIGRLGQGQGLTILDAAGQAIALDRLGWTHF